MSTPKRHITHHLTNLSYTGSQLSLAQWKDGPVRLMRYMLMQLCCRSPVMLMGRTLTLHNGRCLLLCGECCTLKDCCVMFFHQQTLECSWHKSSPRGKKRVFRSRNKEEIKNMERKLRRRIREGKNREEQDGESIGAEQHQLSPEGPENHLRLQGTQLPAYGEPKVGEWPEPFLEPFLPAAVPTACRPCVLPHPDIYPPSHNIQLTALLS